MEAIIVGWGHTKFGKIPDYSLEGLICNAVTEALETAGIEAKEVDAAWLGHFGSGLVADSFCSSMVLSSAPGLRFKPATRCENACASGSAALYSAIDAVRAGRVRVALVVGAEKMTHLSTEAVTRALGRASYQEEESSFSFPDVFAQYARAYEAEFHDPTRAMAAIAVKNHQNALRNPLAHMHRPLDMSFCLEPSEKNPMISAPLKLSDCSPISDGAAAIVIVAADMRCEFKYAAKLRAAVHVNDLLPMSAKRLVDFEGPRRAIAQAYEAAGICVEDLDLAEVHDCFTIAELMMVEALGLAPTGAGSRAVLDGLTQRDGRLPLNLSGGLKAKGHPVGATGISMHILAAKQVLGLAGEMQKRNAHLAMCVNMGGGAVATYASVVEPV